MVVTDNSLDALRVLTASRLVIASRPTQWAKTEMFACACIHREIILLFLIQI